MISIIATLGSPLPQSLADSLVHYAAPAALGTHDCLSAEDACELPVALEGEPAEVILATGDYGTYESPVSGFTVKASTIVHGPPRGEMPLIYIGGGGIKLEGSGATLQRALIHEGAGAVTGVELNGGTMEQDEVRGYNAASPCTGFSGLIRNSICESSSEAPAAAFAARGSTQAPSMLTLRGDTLIGGAIGSHEDSAVEVNLSGGSPLVMDFTNVIARGAGAAVPDIYVKATGTTATLNLDHSNFETAAVAGAVTITPPGSATDQTEPPRLSAEYTELGGATVGAGITSEANGSFDLAGNGRATALSCEPDGRVQTDIGAYQYHPAAMPPCPPLTLKQASPSPMVEIRSAKATLGRHGWVRLNVYCSGPEGFVCSGTTDLHAPNVCCPARDIAPWMRPRPYMLPAGSERPIALRLTRVKIRHRTKAVADFRVQGGSDVHKLVTLHPAPR